VVIETCAKCPGGPTRIRVTDVQAPSASDLQHWHFRRLSRFGSSLVVLRFAADTRGQHGTLHYTGFSIARYSVPRRGRRGGSQERRREGGTRERGKGRRKSLGLLVARQQELGR
jgi:hypothetical protein